MPKKSIMQMSMIADNLQLTKNGQGYSGMHKLTTENRQLVQSKDEGQKIDE